MAIIGPLKRVWKTVGSHGKVCENAGNFEMDIEWHPCRKTINHLNLKLIMYTL